MNKAVLLRTTLLASFATFSLGFAQVPGKLGGYLTTTYDMDVLQNRPAVIELSPGYTSSLTFDDEILSIESGRPELFELKVDAEQQPNKAVLRPLKTSGRTDLKVTTLDGKEAFFILKISQQGSSKNYRITSKEPKYAEAKAPVSPAVEGSAAEVQKLVTSKTQQKTQAKTPSPKAETPSLQVASAREQEPEAWLPLTLTTTVGQDGKVAVQYLISNNGNARIAIDPARLAVEQNGEAITFRFLSSGERWLDPGKTDFGMILIDKAPAGEFKVRWTLTRFGDGTNYTYNRLVKANAAPQN